MASTRPPRRLTDRIIDARMWAGIVWVGLVMATVTLVALDLRLEGGIFGGSGGIEEARTMAFTTLVLAQLFNCFNARSDTTSAFHQFFASRGSSWRGIPGRKPRRQVRGAIGRPAGRTTRYR